MDTITKDALDKLQAVIEIAGSQNKASAILGVSQRQIGRFMRDVIGVPVDMIEKCDRIITGCFDLSELDNYTSRRKKESDQKVASANVASLPNPEFNEFDEKDVIKEVLLMEAVIDECVLKAEIKAIHYGNTIQVLTHDNTIIVLPQSASITIIKIPENDDEVIHNRKNEIKFEGQPRFCAYYVLDGELNFEKYARPFWDEEKIKILFDRGVKCIIFSQDFLPISPLFCNMD